MEQQSFDRELAMQAELFRVENDQISDGGDSDEYSFTLSDSPGREPAMAMTSSRIGEEDYAISFSFSTQFGAFTENPSTGCSVSSPEPLGQPLWILRSREHDDDLQFKEAPAPAAFASRGHAQVLFHAAAPCNQPLIPLGFDDLVDDDHDKLNQSLLSSTVSASRCSFDEQGCRSLSIGSQSSGLWGSSDGHSERTSCSSSGNSEDSRFSRKDPNRVFRNNSHLEEKEEPPHRKPQMLKQVSNAHPQDQLRQGKPNQARDAAVAHDQERVPSSSRFPQKSTFSLLRSSATSPAQAQAACTTQKNDSIPSAQGIISGAPSPRPTSLKVWKLLSLQPLNPTHMRRDHELQEVRARRLSQSFIERSKSQGSSSNQGRYVWSPSTAVDSQAQSSQSSTPSHHGAYHRRPAAARHEDLEENPGQNSPEPWENERESYWARLWSRCLWFRHCKSDEEVVNSVEKRPGKHQNSGFSWTDRRLPEVRLFRANKEALKVAIHGALARCKSTHQHQYEGLSKSHTRL